MEETIEAPQQVSESLQDSAVRYAEERHWEVFPGTWLADDSGPPRCSCRNPGCGQPGAHPTRADWAAQASGSVVAVRRMWAKQPRASVLLPTGRAFDVLEVSELSGCLALARMERMGLQLGPVACSRDRRLLFLVLPGASSKVPDLLHRLGWVPGNLDLISRGEGDYIVAPPTRIGPQGCVRWARPPTSLNRWLPEAEELISPLAYACGREAAAARAR